MAVPEPFELQLFLTPFVLPLLLILAVAFTVFWIDPHDLGSQNSIGATHLLALFVLSAVSVYRSGRGRARPHILAPRSGPMESYDRS